MDLLHSRRKALTGGEGLFLILPRRGCSLVDRVARQGVHFQGRLSRRRTWFVRTGLHHLLASPTPRILEPHCVWEPRDLFIFPCLQQTAQKRIETAALLAVPCSGIGLSRPCVSSSFVDEEAQAFRASQAPPLRPQGTVMSVLPPKRARSRAGSFHSSETRDPRLAFGTRQRDTASFKLQAVRPYCSPSINNNVTQGDSWEINRCAEITQEGTSLTKLPLDAAGVLIRRR